eukprot:767125-Hanusia_phi.AAC.11
MLQHRSSSRAILGLLLLFASSHHGGACPVTNKCLPPHACSQSSDSHVLCCDGARKGRGRQTS